MSVLALFAYTGFRVVPSANRIMLNVGYMREAHPWIRNMDEDMRKLRVPPAKPYEHDRPLMQSSLSCENVSFGYEGGPPLALDDISFTIERGQSVGIVGPTGAGKSTLVDVLLGLLPPTTGRVLIDGEPLEGRERSWQRQIGYVSQDVYLLDDSLRRNIAFGIPDGAIDEARLAAAIAQARLDEVVAALPSRLDTVVGENGIRLSGGQRQRVAIARALYHDPPVLFFDEATAALDNQTEREVSEAIANVRGTRHDHRDRASAVDGEELRSLDLPSRRQARRPRHVSGIDQRSRLPPAHLRRDPRLSCWNSFTIERTCCMNLVVENCSLTIASPSRSRCCSEALASVAEIFCTASSSDSYINAGSRPTISICPPPRGTQTIAPARAISAGAMPKCSSRMP